MRQDAAARCVCCSSVCVCAAAVCVLQDLLHVGAAFDSVQMNSYHFSNKFNTEAEPTQTLVRGMCGRGLYNVGVVCWMGRGMHNMGGACAVDVDSSLWVWML